MPEKLTKVQVEALAALDSWRRGLSVPTSSLRGDGVSLSTLRTLEAIALVSSERATNGIYWKITDAGRYALKGEQDGQP